MLGFTQQADSRQMDECLKFEAITQQQQQKTQPQHNKTTEQQRQRHINEQ
jgi:hypothetical protein